MSELIIFNNPEFGQIRTIEEDGKVLFCGSDVAKALGYKRPMGGFCSLQGGGEAPHPYKRRRTGNELYPRG